MLPKRSPVPFDELRRFLLELGFAQARRDDFWRFEHASSQAVLVYRLYGSGETVTVLDLHRTRRDLDCLGILDEQSFDDRLRKATA